VSRRNAYLNASPKHQGLGTTDKVQNTEQNFRPALYTVYMYVTSTVALKGS